MSVDLLLNSFMRLTPGHSLSYIFSWVYYNFLAVANTLAYSIPTKKKFCNTANREDPQGELRGRNILTYMGSDSDQVSILLNFLHP